MKIVVPVLAGLVAVSGCAASGHPAPRPTVTVTRTAPPRTVYRTRTVYKTRVVTRTVAVPGPGTYGCYHASGVLWVPAVGGAGGTVYQCTVTFGHKPGEPDSAGPAMYWTGPDGTTTDYSMDFAN